MATAPDPFSPSGLQSRTFYRGISGKSGDVFRVDYSGFTSGRQLTRDWHAQTAASFGFSAHDDGDFTDYSRIDNGNRS